MALVLLGQVCSADLESGYSALIYAFKINSSRSLTRFFGLDDFRLLLVYNRHSDVMRGCIDVQAIGVPAIIEAYFLVFTHLYAPHVGVVA